MGIKEWKELLSEPVFMGILVLYCFVIILVVFTALGFTDSRSQNDIEQEIITSLNCPELIEKLGTMVDIPHVTFSSNVAVKQWIVEECWKAENNQ